MPPSLSVSNNVVVIAGPTFGIEGPLTTKTRHTLNSTATNYTFSITPAFLKFTLRLDSWNWSSRFAAIPRDMKYRKEEADRGWW
jgi:hypothetical protein